MMQSSCSDAKNSGFSVDGSFQQWAVSYANVSSVLFETTRGSRTCQADFFLVRLSVQHLTPLPDGFPLEEAAPILCAGVTVYKALKTAALATGEVVV